jgi:hypothetical protein
MDCLVLIPKRVLSSLYKEIAYAIKFRRICFNPCQGLFFLGIKVAASCGQSTGYHDSLSFDLFNSQISLNLEITCH